MQETCDEMKLPSIDTTLVRQQLVKFIRNEVDKSPYDKCIMGLSGGMCGSINV